MAKHRNSFWNVGILLCIVAAGCVFIALLPLLRVSGPVLPPEPAEQVAKRFAPDNAYSMVVEALALLPKRPQPLKVPKKRDPRFLQDYVAERGSLAWLTGVRRPDDDPEFLAYIEACKPALAKAREALQRPYFLIPIDWANPPPLDTEKDPRAPLGGLYALGGGFAVQSVLALRGGDEAAALDYALDGARLALLLSREMTVFGVFAPFTERTYEIARQASEATLERAATEIASVRERLGSNEEVFSFFLRDLDRYLCHAWERIPAGSAETLFKRVLWHVRARGVRKWIVANRESLFAYADKPFPETSAWAKGIVGKETSIDLSRAAGFLDSGRGRGMLGTEWDVRKFIVDTVRGINAYKTRYAFTMDGAALTVALERFRRGEGSYPEKLDALVPKYIQAVPSDVISGGALVYARDGDDYRLYPVGVNQRDEGGRPVEDENGELRGDDTVIHWPGEKTI